MKALGILMLSCVFVPFAPHEARPGDNGFVVQSQLSPAAGQAALHWAVVGAYRRLQQPACQGLFSEFSDASGRTLQEDLDAIGLSGATYLGRILFADGSNRSRCKMTGGLAFTTPKSRMVYVCGRQLKDLADRNPARAQAIIIHEALHTLGLGENPPSSSEITERVLARCR